MRISDWSSDVCSSDLVTGAIKPVAVLRELLPAFHEPISAQMGIGAHAGLLRHRLDHRPAAARRRLAEQCRIALHRRCEVARGSRPELVQRLPCEIGRAHVCTPVTNAPLVCRLILETKKIN